MASSQTPREIMSALIESRAARIRSKTVLPMIVDGNKFICSYGPHFVMAYALGPDWFVTDAKYSATTSTHQRGVREALRDHGYAPTGYYTKEGYEKWQRES